MFDWLAQQFKNPLFSGAVGFSAVGGLTYILRDAPLALYRRFIWSISHTVVLNNDTDAYDHMLRWLTPKLNGWHVREYTISTTGNNNGFFGRNEDRWSLNAGYGKFWLTWKKGFYWVSRDINKEGVGPSLKPRETIMIRSFGFSSKKLHALVEAAENEMLDLDSINVFQWNDYWRYVDSFKPRSLASIALPEGVMENIIGDIELFQTAKEKYQSRGIPYRRGYLFSGLPGTGKSSTAIAVAGHLNRPVFVLGLSSVRDDAALFNAFAGVPARGIILIEDVDATGVTAIHSRGDDVPDKKEDDDGPMGITLSGLLNVIDGVVAKEGRILIMTTNHPEKLDAALLRPGRVDKTVTFGLATTEQVILIFNKFYGSFDESLLKRYLGDKTPAEIQGICQEHEEDLGGAIEKLSPPASKIRVVGAE